MCKQILQELSQLKTTVCHRPHVLHFVYYHKIYLTSLSLLFCAATTATAWVETRSYSVRLWLGSSCTIIALKNSLRQQ